jgi:glycerate kinase
MRPIQASYTRSHDGQTAVIEMAQASGLALLTPAERNCLDTTSYGTGELMADALRLGARRLVIGIGGSATCDGGLGMAAALGIRLFDAQGKRLDPIGRNMSQLARFELPETPTWAGVTIEVACDVSNPLTGPQGAAPVYAPQKGATPAAVAQLAAGLAHLDTCWQAQWGHSFDEVPGAGAAGGLGAGLMAFVGGQLRPGIELVMREAGIDQALAQTDLVLTGEGRLDGQTLAGKVIQGICARAAHHRVPVAALCGAIDLSPQQQRQVGLAYAASISPGPMPLEQALGEASSHLVQATFSLVNLVTRYQAS